MAEENVLESGDTIDVPDELVEQMGLPPEEDDNKDDLDKQKKEDTGKEADNPSKPLNTEDESQDKDKDKQAQEPPIDYAKKKERTSKRIRELTTKSYEANQRADDAESALEAERAETAKLRSQIETNGRAHENDDVIAELDELIEFAEDDGKTASVKILKDRRERLRNGDVEDAPVRRESQEHSETRQESDGEVDPATTQWLSDNEWYSATDELGRIRYPQLRREAEYQHDLLLKTMKPGKEMYAALNDEMEQQLEAFGINSMKPDADPPSEEEDKPRPGLQTHRGGGGESDSKPKSDHLSDKEVTYMKQQFRILKWKDTPEHRQVWIANYRR